ncbi:group II intron reverse transcriptase/maturase [Clostridium botulinum]|uniref:group II intron reverse transcriptase/maturase n=1 Tax=Clostridium botulinum TaxID=1491 RepID=UPI00339D7C47
MKESFKLKKRRLLRNNEYYCIQNIFDDLYTKSKNNHKFTNLMQHITSKENILLAYRNIKKNKGSTTSGTDKLDISYIKDMKENEFIEFIQNKFDNYCPKSVRRVEIPKPDGKTRPLGIPCIDDRLVQQCIKQILEPICEAKFYKHSYGFRPNRSTDHAISRSMFLINKNKLHYVVDIDIKGFFDNVNHAKLKKQMWKLGIQDKNLLCIINKILKSEIQGIGIPTKGTPQGGIISPLLSNIVLNELDWWISSQWDNFPTKFSYGHPREKARALRDNSNLKEIWIVRYADDFKIFCRNHKVAFKIYNATKSWLKKRLELEINPQKSKVTNLRKNYTEFLGFKLKAVRKRDKYICHSYMTDKAKKTTIQKFKKQIKVIRQKTIASEVNKLNAMILGTHNYFKKASHISRDMSEIHFLVRKTLYNSLKNDLNFRLYKTKTYERLYGKCKGRAYSIGRVTIFPIYHCQTSPPMNFRQEICNYSEEGRRTIHDKLGNYSYLIEYLLAHTHESKSVEYYNNSIALISGQQGKCFVTKEPLIIHNMECHHKTPKSLGGTDEYKNLVWLNGYVHKLIHATKQETINKYKMKISIDTNGINRVNSLRKLVGNSVI